MTIEHSLSREAKAREFIELINVLGINVLSIQGEYYAATEFDSQDPDSGIFEHTLYGRDITSLVLNSLDNISVDNMRQREIITQINSKKEVRKRFHRDIIYVVHSHSV